MADGTGKQGNRDAQFRFALSEDGMTLGVSRYFPPNGGEGPSVELLCRQVAAAGINLPVDEDAARKVVESVRDGEDIKRVALVRGTPVQEPRHASLVALGNLDFPVFPGDAFARKNPPLQARDGVTIDGRVIKAKESFKPDDVQAKMGENVDFEPLTGNFIAQVWGMARLKDGVIRVDPLYHISEDGIEVRGTLYPKDFKGGPISPARVEKELRDIGVAIDIDLDRIDKKLNKIAKFDKVIPDFLFVSGTHPVPGRDGWFEYLVSSREDTGTEDDSGRLDFKDRGSYPMVNQGQVIGRLHAPSQGEGGIDIWGKTIPATAGKPLHVHKGKNVILHDDKVTFEAKGRGVVVMERGTLDVFDCLFINGNVDLESGNVKVEHGSIKIQGSIQAGFEVSAPENIIVGGSIESAKVYAGGNIEVAGGILMPEGGQVKAEGDVVCNYATNANIIAGGNVDVANDVTNCDIIAEGRFLAVRGKGIVQGGDIVAAKGMEIKELGSELGVETNVAVRVEDADDEDLRQERVKVKQAIQKIDDALGSDPPDHILRRTPPEKRSAVAEILKHRITLVKRRKAISEQLNQIALKCQEELAGVKIIVRVLIHPGTTLKFGGRVFPIVKRTEASSVYWSEAKRDIIFE